MSENSLLPRQREAALRALVGEHFDFIWRLLRRMGLSADDADDATQQVFMTLTQKFERIERGSERSYLYGVALRVLANTRRKRARSREDLVEDGSAREDEAELPDRVLEGEQTRATLDALLDDLPDELRRVLILTAIEELPMVEVATLEGIPPGTVASRLRRARAILRERLEASERETAPGGVRS